MLKNTEEFTKYNHNRVSPNNDKISKALLYFLQTFLFFCDVLQFPFLPDHFVHFVPPCTLYFGLIKPEGTLKANTKKVLYKFALLATAVDLLRYIS